MTSSAKPLPSLEYLHEMLEVRDSLLYWRIAKPGRSLDAPAGWTNGHGYVCVWIDGCYYRAHRIIYYMHHNVEPDYVDHINGIRDDNRIENLRSVNKFENAKNTRLHKSNTSGHIGVCWNKSRNRWRARLIANGKDVCLGYFVDIADAVAARDAADVKFGFHRNHGTPFGVEVKP